VSKLDNTNYGPGTYRHERHCKASREYSQGSPGCTCKPGVLTDFEKGKIEQARQDKVRVDGLLDEMRGRLTAANERAEGLSDANEALGSERDGWLRKLGAMTLARDDSTRHNTELAKLIAARDATITRLGKALPDPVKLRLLADWHDTYDQPRQPRGHEVQDDLRRWADEAEAAREGAGD